MNQNTNWILGAGVVVAIVLSLLTLGIALSKPASAPGYGGVTNYDEVDAAALRVGTSSNSTRLGNLQFGTCSLIAPSYSVAASTTVPMDCAIAGVLSTDGVFAQFATSTATSYGGWQIRGAAASSTNGFITISVVNGTGSASASVIPASIASSTKYIILRSRSTVPGL